MNKQIAFSKDKLELFLLTELLICKSYNDKNVLEETSDNISKDFCEFYKFDINDNNYKKMYDFAKNSIEYMNKLSAITSMYSTFEQFIKISLNLSNNDMSLEKKINAKCKEYQCQYCVEENSYYELFNKYRMVNNAIKHGNITMELKRNYPNLFNKACNSKTYGTILDSSLNITDDEVIECYTGLCEFAKEMYSYFEDLGYIN